MTPIETLIAEAAEYAWQDIRDRPSNVLLIFARFYENGMKEIAWGHYSNGSYYSECNIPTHFRHLDTPDNDITARLAAALEAAVEAVENLDVDGAANERYRADTLAHINTIASRGDAVVEGT